MQQKENVQLNRSLGLWSALALVIGTVIGSGIFFKQASVLSLAGSTTTALWAWFLGGVITLTAGLTIAEIGAQMPHTGGLYVYMEKMYGKLWGFLAGWMQIIVYGPAMIASLAAYLAILLTDFFHLSSSLRIPLALLAILFIGLINFLSNRFGATIQILTTLGKLLPIAAIIIFGLLFGDHAALNQTVTTASSGSNGSFGVAILATLFAYDGWILIANMGGEIKNPKKMLPRAISFGIILVLICYMLVTLGVFRTMTAQRIVNLGQNATPAFAVTAFGDIGGKLLNIGVIISILGCMNGKVMTFPRIMYAMAKNHEIPFSKTLSYLHPKTRAPLFSTTAIMLIAGIMVIFFNPDRLSEICIFTVYVFYVMAFVGLFLLRRRNPNQKRAFNVPLYPLTPIVAIAGALFVIVSEIQSDIVGVGVSFIFVVIGIPIYYYEKAQERKELKK
ncbi:APC family permease [Loigolactobacillus iwatensis]|uniref:APC family permease n=1 Tax=Loigolactobacillus iwatensis TaxID=1267156 RepID=UPI000F7E2EE3|nr:amino acid permease [Loigolactobacillus iwatensis]